MGFRLPRPSPIPTRTRVSRQAPLLISKSSSHSTVPFSNRTTIVEPPVERTNVSRVRHTYITALTERKVSELVTSFDLGALFHRCVDAPNHHRADADAHDTPKLRAINGNDLANVLAVNVERGPDSLWLDNTTSAWFLERMRAVYAR